MMGVVADLLVLDAYGNASNLGTSTYSPPLLASTSRWMVCLPATGIGKDFGSYRHARIINHWRCSIARLPDTCPPVVLGCVVHMYLYYILRRADRYGGIRARTTVITSLQDAWTHEATPSRYPGAIVPSHWSTTYTRAMCVPGHPPSTHPCNLSTHYTE